MNAGIKKIRSLKGILRTAMLVLMLVPFIAASVVSGVVVSRQTSGFAADSNAALAFSQSRAVSALVGEYVAFLDSVSALEIMRHTSSDTSAREIARNVIYSNAEHLPGIRDILLTNPDGTIWASHFAPLSIGKFFHDTTALEAISHTPTPVSEFYHVENNQRFFVSRPLTCENGTTLYGYVVMEIGASVLYDYLERSVAGGDAAHGNTGKILAIFDTERGSIISSSGEAGDILRDCVESYRAGTLYAVTPTPANNPDRRFERNGHFGTVRSVPGTRWRWISLEPTANANNSARSVLLTAFALAGVLSLVNLAVMLRVSARVFAKGEFARLENEINEIIELSAIENESAFSNEGSGNTFEPVVDYLTELYDRGTFMKLLNELLIHGKNPEDVTVLMLEIADFKALCGKLGHSAGDEVLVFTAARLKGLVLMASSESASNESFAGENFAGRLSGSEFGLCISRRPNTIEDTDGIEQLCNAITDELARGFAAQLQGATREMQVSIAATIGVSGTLRAGMTAKQLIAQADSALYHAKKAGKNYSIFKED
ncbi:MAG: diguanylate cyclase [Oscillospiraceae bacterium]|nr:diguanylate cyclase [Oscillospiraceae bacterium]